MGDARENKKLNINILVKHKLPASLPFLFIVVIWFIFSSPYFLKGKMPYSSTYQVNNFAPWDAYPQFGSPVKNGAMPDITTQIYPWKHFTIETWKSGQIPFWNPYSFSGTPHLANYQSAVLSPFNLLFFILSFKDAWSLLILLQPLLAGIFMYLYTRALNISKLASLFSSIAFMFCGFITVWMDYGTLAYAILFLPLALFAVEKYFYTKKTFYGVILSLSIPLSFFSGHFQISIYFLLCVLFYQLFNFLVKKNIKQSLYLLIFSFCGLLISLPQILPSLEFYSQALRSTFFQKSESIPWSYLPTFLAPDFFGNPVTRNDWFGHYAEWNAYIGVLPIIFGFYGLKRREKLIFFYLALLLVALFMAFFIPLINLIILLHIPVLSTSAASRIIVLFSFGLIVLSGIGFDQLINDIVKRNYKPILFGLTILTSIFAILWLIVILKILIPIAKISIAKQNLILPTALFLFAVIFTSAVIIGSKLKAELKRYSVLIISLFFVMITSFEMLRFAMKWQAFDSKQLAFADIPVTDFFPKIEGFQRVIGNFGAETAVYYHLPSLEGYDALYINRYGEFIASLTDGRVKSAERSVITFPKDSPYTGKAINLLDVAYIVHKVSDDFTGWTFPYWKYPESQFQKVYDDGAYRVYKNITAYPHAFLIHSFVIKNNRQDIFSTMFAKDFNLRRQIVLEKNPGINSIQQEDKGDATISSFTPNYISIRTDSVSDGMLFMSDPFYPGWQATIDGKATEIYRADYAFRAIKISRGKHNVKLTYKPLSFITGIYAAIVGFLLLIVIICIKKKKLIFISV